MGRWIFLGKRLPIMRQEVREGSAMFMVATQWKANLRHGMHVEVLDVSEDKGRESGKKMSTKVGKSVGGIISEPEIWD